MASAFETKPETLDGEKVRSVMDQDDDPSISNIEEKPLVRKTDLHFIWAVVLGCHGASENFAAFCSLRVLLGAYEATISPGFTLITELWYKPSDHAARHSLWFLENSVGSLLGSLIAYGCTFITGGPLAPWRVSSPPLNLFFPRQSLLLGMPLAVYNVIVVLLSAWLTKRFRKSRCIVAASASALSLVGTILVRQLPATDNAGRYIGLILCASCANVFPMMLSLISNNVAGFTKKSTVNIVFLLGYCAGNIAGPQFFIPTEAQIRHKKRSSPSLDFLIADFIPCLPLDSFHRFICHLLHPYWPHSCL
ncbi:hypothetical protein BFJ72_g10013 [Fusarium proliferatum]|uniref:Major facilitator superfamily (MFS) profile domain-containing protein n=1 Tax=Gibberella intermedia TaxID=948311 RepID=A0A420SW63_GIBIN|nr:hypothetical protein BFJ72_g10013 [Fusarium proliferatum]